MRALLISIITFSLLSIVIAQGQDDDFLDLTKNRPPQRKRLFGKGSGALTGGENGTRPQKPFPLKITLLSLSKQSYQLGEEAIYEVLLENISQDTLIFPWSANYDRVKPEEEIDPPSYVKAFLTLVIKDESLVDEFFAGEVIHGSQLLPGSLKTLRPGRKVRIRAPGRMVFTNTEMYKRVSHKLPHTFKVQASVSLSNLPVDSIHRSAISSNSLIVELRKRSE